ncbi:hypothetical protein BDQ17DRAFT_1349102 [Cyathus striatus]|nr:hypothetical protein BDQ17DRAFT_1349102 [Cyathus striatus]
MAQSSATTEPPTQRMPLQPKSHPVATASPSMPTKPTGQNSQSKKVSRRGSKPIINWFQRKLAGTVKPKRIENFPLAVADPGKGGGRNNTPRVGGRIVSSPSPGPRYHTKSESTAGARRKTISLNGDEDFQSYRDDDTSFGRSSFARDSVWSPASALEADEDASLRPLPPSTPPSPSPSRSSSSYLSDPRTFRSMAASTKPTTVLSIDIHTGGMAHIAQAPATSTSQSHRVTPHARHSSSLSSAGVLANGAAVAFSSLPQAPARPPSGQTTTLNTSPQTPNNGAGPLVAVQAPLHTAHHPRNNPRPSSPPLDNASVLTLASSAFAFAGRSGPTAYPSTLSGPGAGDSISHFGGSTYADAESRSEFVLGDDLDERDVDASLRALRPRSSRRSSWESEVSRWSARVPQGMGTPSLARERSLWTANSMRTEGLDGDDRRDDESPPSKGENTSLTASIVPSSSTDTQPISPVSPVLVEEGLNSVSNV